MLFNKQITLLALTIPSLLIGAEVANAQALTANYTSEANVTDFNSYDFGGGILLIKAQDFSSFGVGSEINGYYQTYVNSHQLDGTGVSNATLNNTGAGSGYELTMLADFTASITDIYSPGSFGFNIISGNATLYLDTTPDYNFSTDTGFSDGDVLLASQEASGNGFISPFGFGAVQIDFLPPSIVNHDVYGAITLEEATALFALDANNSAQTSGISSVAGSQVNPGDFLYAVDGNMQLSQSTVVATPLPMSFWLFGSAIASLVSFTRRKKQPIVV